MSTAQNAAMSTTTTPHPMRPHFRQPLLFCGGGVTAGAGGGGGGGGAVGGGTYGGVVIATSYSRAARRAPSRAPRRLRSAPRGRTPLRAARARARRTSARP